MVILLEECSLVVASYHLSVALTLDLLEVETIAPVVSRVLSVIILFMVCLSIMAKKKPISCFQLVHGCCSKKASTDRVISVISYERIDVLYLESRL